MALGTSELIRAQTAPQSSPPIKVTIHDPTTPSLAGSSSVDGGGSFTYTVLDQKGKAIVKILDGVQPSEDIPQGGEVYTYYISDPNHPLGTETNVAEIFNTTFGATIDSNGKFTDTPVGLSAAGAAAKFTQYVSGSGTVLYVQSVRYKQYGVPRPTDGTTASLTPVKQTVVQKITKTTLNGVVSYGISTVSVSSELAP